MVKSTYDYITNGDNSNVRKRRTVGKGNGTADAQPMDEKGVAPRDATGGRSIATTSTTAVSVDDPAQPNKGVPSSTDLGPLEGNSDQSAPTFSGRTSMSPVDETGGVTSVEKGTPEGNDASKTSPQKEEKSSTSMQSNPRADRLEVYKRQAADGSVLGIRNDLPLKTGLNGAVSGTESGSHGDGEKKGKLSSSVTEDYNGIEEDPAPKIDNPFKKKEKLPGVADGEAVMGRNAADDVLSDMDKEKQELRDKTYADNIIKGAASKLGINLDKNNPSKTDKKDDVANEMDSKIQKLRAAIDEWGKDDEKKKKRYRSRQILNAIGDGLAAIANLYYAGRGAPNMLHPEKDSMLRKSKAWFDEQRKERLGERDKMKTDLDRLEGAMRQYKQHKEVMDFNREKAEMDDRRANLKMQIDALNKAGDREWDRQKHADNLKSKEEDRKAADRRAAVAASSRLKAAEISGRNKGKDKENKYSGKTETGGDYWIGFNNKSYHFPKERLTEENLRGLYNKLPEKYKVTINGGKNSANKWDRNPGETARDMLHAIATYINEEKRRGPNTAKSVYANFAHKLWELAGKPAGEGNNKFIIGGLDEKDMVDAMNRKKGNGKADNTMPGAEPKNDEKADSNTMPGVPVTNK